MGRYKDAVNAVTTGDLDNPWAHLELIYAYMELGREGDAEAEAKEVLRLAPNFAASDIFLAGAGTSPFWQHYYDALLRAGLK